MGRAEEEAETQLVPEPDEAEVHRSPEERQLGTRSVRAGADSKRLAEEGLAVHVPGGGRALQAPRAEGLVEALPPRQQEEERQNVRGHSLGPFRVQEQRGGGQRGAAGDVRQGLDPRRQPSGNEEDDVLWQRHELDSEWQRKGGRVRGSSGGIEDERGDVQRAAVAAAVWVQEHA